VHTPPTHSHPHMPNETVAEWCRDWPAAESAQVAVEAGEWDTTDQAHADGNSGGKDGGAGPLKAGAIKGPGHHSLMAAAWASASLNNAPRQAFRSEVAS
jgi:hypothetical protein